MSSVTTTIATAGRRFAAVLLIGSAAAGCASSSHAGERVYHNRLVPIAEPQPLLADHPEFVEPIEETARFEAPPVIDEDGADLAVRAWRFSYNARGIVEVPNRLRSDRTAVIVVHPWGIDDGQGWITPEPAGVAFQCTPDKNRLVRKHAETVVDPLLKRLRPHAALTIYSLPGVEDPIRKKLYRSFRSRPTDADRARGRKESAAVLRGFEYRGKPLPTEITLSDESPVSDYFRQFPGLDAGAKFNNAGFWNLPIPVMKDIEVADDDVVIYDGEGYEALKTFLRGRDIRLVLLAGYNTDMCVCRTTAGYENLRRDFNVFLVGDATIATFPARKSPASATTTAVSFAALNLFITQCSWIETTDKDAK